MQAKGVVLLGSTGSIGTQALEVIEALPQRLHVVGLAAGGANLEAFAAQIRKWQPQVAALHDADAAQRLTELLGPTSTRILSGPQGVCEVATHQDAKIVLGAMLGAAGLEPTLAAINSDKDIAIANKETLVAAGALVTSRARAKGVALLPVDSEHSALAQCLLGEDASSVARLTITASGGPFVDTSRQELQSVRPEQALRHPTWTMGRKITIDSATLMNKALEMIEAHWLFGVPMEQIDVVVHRQSIVHSLVTFCDGSVKAQLGVPDMKLPIQWALLHPERVAGAAPPLDLAKMGQLSFEAPDEARFPALALGRQAMKMGGLAPCALNAANEIAVEAFLNGQTGFYGITDCVEAVLERHASQARPDKELTLQDVQQADFQARRLAHEFLRN